MSGNSRKRRGDGRPTIAQVAALAGVGTMTASRALRTPHLVSDALRASVERAVEELNYVPNLSARALASKSSDVVVVLVPTLTQHIFSEVVKGIYDGLEGTPLQVQIGNTRYDAEEEERLLRVFLRQRPSAVIVSGTHQSKASRQLLERAGCPVVQIMDVSDDPIDRIVGYSHVDAGYAATRHLIEKGYERLAFFTGWMHQRAEGRLRGFEQATREAGIYRPDLIFRVEDRVSFDLGSTMAGPNRRFGSHPFSSPGLGRAMLSDALDLPRPPDAVFCNNDILAIGVLFEAHSRGIAVPDQLGICGFNDLDLMAAAHPSLSSLRTLRYEIGFESVQVIRRALDGRPDDQKIRNMGFEVMARQSTNRNGG
ncbi:LacI family DNA-binding transcriptional regulator [Pelagibacterium montanilacus]|uniref:LacI family DNA-binding transcriptional regulator n=1 Tax=Pelagibacterium montanilacus TaxID=2185280 RepID=UPI000F8E3507|nr:LacI family DNA-binding transcriptional regulator [Pelagibacterium montanilacus]